MQLNLLNSVKEQKSIQDAKRVEKANAKIAFAQECLKKSLETEFKDKQLLVDACDALFFAIQTHRVNPEPLALMGYILLLLEDRRRAVNYLKRALELDPSHSDALMLMDYLLNPPETVHSAPSDPKPLELSFPSIPLDQELDYDALFDQCEQAIQKEVLAIMQLPQPQLVFTQSEVQTLQSQLETLSESQREFQRLLKIIDEEIETTDLENMLTPLNVFIKRLTGVLSDSNRAKELFQELQEKRTLLAGWVKSEPGSQVRLSASELDQWLDRCDQLADSIDAFENFGYEVSPLVTVYEELAKSLEEYQDLYC